MVSKDIKSLREAKGDFFMGIGLTDNGIKLDTDKCSYNLAIEEPSVDDYEDIEINGDLSLLGEQILNITYEYTENFDSYSLNSGNYTHNIEILFMLKSINIFITRHEPIKE